jgi:hypothetical protein
MARFHVTDSLRLTVDSPQCCAPDGNTATERSRAAGGLRSHAMNPATSSSRTSRQSRPCRARNTNQSFRSCA